MLGWAREAGWGEVLVVGIGLNLATTGASVLLWRVLVGHRGVETVTRGVDRRDLVLAASTTAVNAVALVPAWWLWREGHIDVTEGVGWRTPLELAYLVVGVDTVMYWLHRLFHRPEAYRWAHAVHHEGDPRMSPLTLFVMHPAEAAGFSIVMAALIALVPVSTAAIGAFFAVNLWVGTVAHVPQRDGHVPSRWDRLVGGSGLHQAHHDSPRSSYGFFTTAWDSLARTRSTERSLSR